MTPPLHVRPTLLRLAATTLLLTAFVSPVAAQMLSAPAGKWDMGEGRTHEGSLDQVCVKYVAELPRLANRAAPRLTGEVRRVPQTPFAFQCRIEMTQSDGKLRQVWSDPFINADMIPAHLRAAAMQEPSQAQ